MERLKEPEKIQKMFDKIAPKYDFMNNIISFGTQKFLKNSVIKKLNLTHGSTVLDLCCGTGDIAKLLANRDEVKRVVAIDFSSEMLNIAQKKNSHSKIEYIKADCTNLPFENDVFDLATIFFGLRNIENIELALHEIYRVLKPNGDFVHFDFSNKNKFSNFIFDFYTPLVAGIFTKYKTAYEYLVKSKKEFYSEEKLNKFIVTKGFLFDKKYEFLFFSLSALLYKKSILSNSVRF